MPGPQTIRGALYSVMEDLHSRWELPSIAHFVSTFHGAFSLPELHVEELENGFLASCTAEGSDLLNQLIAALLSGFYSSKSIEFYNYESPLRDYLHQKWAVECKRENPLVNRDFRELSLHDKVDIVYSLCMSRLDAEDVADAIKQLSGEDMRVEPVGCDGRGCHYWNFNDERLYKEEPMLENPEKHKKRKHKEKHKKKKHKNRDSVDTADEAEPKVVYGKWTIQCSTEEDWQEFVKDLKKSSNKQDKKLRKIIINDFVPLISDIIEEKEKAMKRRLLEMLPKRESNRLARKRAEMDEQKAIMARIEAEEREEMRQRELEKKRYAEQKRREEMAREREERILAREHEKRARDQARQDRAMRALMREHKLISGALNSADDASMTEESSEDTDWEEYNATAGGTHVTLSHRQRTKRNRQLNGPTKTTEFGPKEYEKINRILYQLQRDSNCWPFLEPVTTDIAPDYFEIIKNPMDISVMRRKAGKKEYTSKIQFITDFDLIVENCTKYNGANSEYGGMAINLKKKFDSLMDKSFHEDDSKPQRRKSSTEATRNVSYQEQLSDSSSVSDSESNNNNDSDFSNDSYERPQRGYISKSTRGRPRNAGNRQRVQSVRANVNTGGISSEESSESDQPDESSNSYNLIASSNPPARTNSYDMSQSQQILMDTSPHNVPTDSKLLFGIARHNSANSHLSTQHAGTPPRQAELSEHKPSEKSKHISLLSPTHSLATRGDRGMELARWMGKSPPLTTTISNGTTAITSQHNPSSNNGLKFEQNSVPEEPFQGLVAQLKRSSVDTAPTGPTYKRVA
ncbi:chromatin remodeling regulator CECR2-like [Watersipora subatra]|uniref:chromatin remodeling regulator CECR2-like n=1 Tax=Watersipora subatra TaxID=2589382 RepID=UPI00355BF64E